MAHPYETAAMRIIGALHDAEDDLLGFAVVTTSAEAGTVRDVKLDETHGLCFTLDPIHWLFKRRWSPVSTIKVVSRV